MSRWLSRNQSFVNLKKGKTESMLFGTHQKINKQISLKVFFNGQVINATNSYKYLGIELDQTLHLAKNFQKCFKKASGRLRLLSRVRHLLTPYAAHTLYKAVVLPIVTYCASINICSTDTQKRKLESIKNRGERIINRNCKYVANLTSIHEIQKKHFCMLVFKCLNGKMNEHFHNYFEVLISNSQTRNNGISIRLPRVRLEQARKSFYFLGGKLYNGLSVKARRADSVKKFKYLMESE